MIFDSVGNMTGLIDSVNNRTTFVFDSLNREIQRIDPLNKSATFAYDAASRMTSTTDRLGRKREFTYDALNRLTLETWKDSGGTTTGLLTYTFDAVSNMLTAAKSTGTYTMSYDALNRMATEKEPFGLTLTFSYDAASNRTKVEDSFGGVTTSVYNAVNMLTSRQFGGTGQTPLRIDLTYTNRNEIDVITRWSDLAATQKVGSSDHDYDGTGRLTALTHKNSSDTTIVSYANTFDLVDRITVESLNGTPKTYTYDSTSQLTNDSSTAFSYDLNGNRTMPGYSTGAGNRLTTDGTWNYFYDDEGNRTKKTNISTGETWTFGYDNLNQLTFVEKRATDGGTLLMRADYKYDVFRHRIEKAVDGDGEGSGGPATTRFGYDGPQIWADLTVSNALDTRYIRGDVVDQLSARISSVGTAAWFLTDRMGSVRDIINASGAIIDTIVYGGFGNIQSETSPSVGGDYKYDGYRLDSETGFYRPDGTTGRYYDPLTGTWNGEDPIWPQSGPNPFDYVGNNSPNVTDPYGLFGLKELFRLSQLPTVALVEILSGEEPTVTPIIAEIVVGQPAWAVLQATGRAFWAWVARTQMTAKGLGFAADLLEWSLQDNPKDRVFAANHFGVVKMRNSTEYSEKIKEVVENAPIGLSQGKVAIEFKRGHGVDSDDLFAAVHWANFHYKLQKVDDDNYKIKIKIKDRYNFERNLTGYYSAGNLKAWAGANQAWADQFVRVIVGYNWETVELIEKKGVVTWRCGTEEAK